MLNHIIVGGRLVADPEMHTTNEGIHVATFTIACDRNTKHKGTRVSDFINIVAWRYNADFVDRFFHKGKKIIVEGSLQQRNYTDTDGNKRRVHEVIAERVHFADSIPSGGNDDGRRADY